MPSARTNSKTETKNSKLVVALLAWFATNARDLPWRRTRDPYAIWVSEIMLQQTQVKTVIPYWERWLRELPDIAALASAPPEKIHKLWEGLGYYTRVRNLQKAAQQIIATCSSRREEAHSNNRLSAIGYRKSKPDSPPVSPCQFPEKYEEILALPGVGRYTAGAICSIAFNQPTPILDGNVIRVLTRIFGIAGDPREKQTNAQLWQLAEQLVLNSKLETRNSKLGCSHLNQSLMELGALVCTPRSPQCELCPVKKLCVARRDDLVAQLPNLAQRAAVTARHFLAYVVERDGKFLVRQRPADVVNAHLWEFPNIEVPVRSSAFRRLGDAPDADRLKAELQTSPPFHLAKNARPFCTIRHSITRYRITLEAHRAKLANPRPGASASGPAWNKSSAGNTPNRRPTLQGRWFSLTGLDKLAFTSAHRKILAKLRALEFKLESKL